jgi:hypothetical protein
MKQNTNTFWILAPILFLMLDCNSNKNAETQGTKEFSIGRVTLKLPSTYRVIDGKGIDSYVAYIVNAQDDTFQVEYGSPKTIYRIYDPPPVVYPISVKPQIEKDLGRAPNSSEVVYSKIPSEDKEEGIYMNNYYSYDTLNGLIVKLVLPKRRGIGLTGMLVLDLPDSNCMSIYARNLDSATQDTALILFRSIKLK